MKTRRMSMVFTDPKSVPDFTKRDQLVRHENAIDQPTINRYPLLNCSLRKV